jgi:hypothetical protein
MPDYRDIKYLYMNGERVQSIARRVGELPLEQIRKLGEPCSCWYCGAGYPNMCVKLKGTMDAATNPQNQPVKNENPAVWPLVVADMQARDQFGADKYGTRLQPHNGRDALTDAYQEALDLCVYLRQAIYERDGK